MLLPLILLTSLNLTWGQEQQRVFTAPWEFRAEASVSVLKKGLAQVGAATEVIPNSRDKEVQQAGTKCAMALVKDLFVNPMPPRVARFREESGDSWVFRWQATCPESNL